MLDIEFKSGTRRFVFLIGKYAIKIPKFTDWISFNAGIRENLEERYWWCSEGGVTETWTHSTLAKIYWASRRGFIVVMERCTTPTEDQYCKFISENGYVTSDSHMANFGVTAEGKVVCIDYGFFGGTKDCYLGCPNRKRKN